jgi:hypothetical protein
MDQTGGFVEFSGLSGRDKGTDGAGVEFEEGDMVAGRKTDFIGDCYFRTILHFQTPRRKNTANH